MNEKVKVFGKLPQILTFPFKGEGWFGKLAITALIIVAGGFIPILPTILVLGYFYEMVRRIIVEGKDAHMPEWDDWGEYIKNGFKWFASTLIISVPFVVVFLITMSLYFVPIFFVNNGMSDDVMGPYFAFLFFAQFITIFISIIFMVFMGVFAPVYMTHMVAEGNFKSMFQIKKWWRVLTKGFWEFLISFMLLYGLSMIFYMIYFVMLYSVICCCLSPFVLGFAGAYLMAIYMALVASAYREGRGKSADDEPLPLDDGGDGDAPEPLSTPEPEEDATMIAEAVSAVGEEEFDLPSPDGENPPVEDATIIASADEGVAVAVEGLDAATVRLDDLKKISGIGPKTAEALNLAGIVSFAQLSDTSVEKLKQILVDADLEILAATCDDWPQKAKEML